MPAEIQLTEVTPPVREVRVMLREYAEWLAIDLSVQDFAREVAGLPGDYPRPCGTALSGRDAALWSSA